MNDLRIGTLFTIRNAQRVLDGSERQLLFALKRALARWSEIHQDVWLGQPMGWAPDMKISVIRAWHGRGRARAGKAGV